MRMHGDTPYRSQQKRSCSQQTDSDLLKFFKPFSVFHEVVCLPSSNRMLHFQSISYRTTNVISAMSESTCCLQKRGCFPFTSANSDVIVLLTNQICQKASGRFGHFFQSRASTFDHVHVLYRFLEFFSSSFILPSGIFVESVLRR